MALQLRPGGRAFLVALGLAVIAWALSRAGWMPDRVGPHTQAPHDSLDPFVLPLPVAACDTPLRIAVPPRAASLRLTPSAAAVPEQHGAAALARFVRGEVDGAVASVAEIAALAELPAHARIAEILGGGTDLVLAGAREGNAAALASIAAPTGSAEAFLASAVGVRPQAVDGPGHALRQLGGGRVEGAVLPRWMLGPAGPVGRPAELAVRAPLDPVVLVVGTRARCLGEGHPLAPPRVALEKAFGAVPGELADAPPDPSDLVRAWAGQRRARPALPPLELAVTPALARRIWGAAAEPPPEPPQAPALQPALVPAIDAQSPGEVR